MRIVRNQQNTIALSLYEKKSTENPQWLFKLTNDFTGFSKVFAAEDISDYPDRASIFRITESESEDRANGIVTLTSGRWSYEVYEMAESSPRNLDPDDAIKTVETGICEVYDGSENPVNHFTPEEDGDTPVFDVE